MNRTVYYQKMKALARQVRADHELTTPRVLRADMRRIYRHYKIRIDLWDHRFKQLRGAYFCDDLGATVMLVRGLPADPMVFTMGHELKHHLVDRLTGLSYCDASNANEPIEIEADEVEDFIQFPIHGRGDEFHLPLPKQTDCFAPPWSPLFWLLRSHHVLRLS